MALPRGFKSSAERTAQELRDAVGADPTKPLDLHAVADHVGAQVMSAADLVDLDRLKEIESIQAFSFSACTFEVSGESVIVYNPLRTTERTASDIAHELAHIILKHELSEIQYLDDVPFRTCVADQEEQATALGGTILLPRSLLLDTARAGESWEVLPQRLAVSTDMARYRWNTTGVARQVAAARRTSPW